MKEKKPEADFSVDLEHVHASVLEGDTPITLITSQDDLTAKELQIVNSALEKYGTNGARMSEVFATESTDSTVLTLEDVNELAIGINSDHDKVLRANRIILRNVVADGILGRAFECVTSNINTEYHLTYPIEEDGDDIDPETLKEVKRLIDSFNDEINLKHLIREAASVAYLEGNYPMYLQLDNTNGGAVVSHYSLSLAYPSVYKTNGNPILEFSIKDLKSMLKKTYPKNKKKKSIYYDNMDKEVQAIYPPEVLEGYRNGDDIVKLDDKYSGCILVGDNGRRFGVSPFFRCLKPLIVLTNIEAADVASSKARSKKIIFQKLRKELMGNDGTRKGFGEQAYAHESAAAALKTSFALYTAPAFVESLEYVTDGTSTCDPELLSQYNSKLFTALGIGFADTNVANYSVANISIDQMLRTINSITEQLEEILERFYKVVVTENGYDVKYAPKIRVVDSEQLSMDLRKDIASFVYSQLNGSLETALEYMGLNIKDETERRRKENEAELYDVFFPRATSYTATGDNVGRPQSSDDGDKQDSDRDRTEQGA